MSSLLAIERFVPPYRYSQSEVEGYARAWLSEAGGADARRLLRIYDTAGVRVRGSVLPIEQVFADPDLEARNDAYREAARVAGIDLARRVLASAGLAPAEVGFLVSVSCTGFMIPALDAHVADALGFGPRLARLPITESGCAGGVVALQRAHDYLTAHPDQAALVLAVELSSLTFQRWDRSPANVISAAIFGDGGAACVLVGERHPLAGRRRARIAACESRFFPRTLHLMGFRLRNQGLQILLDRELAPFVRRHVREVVEGFIERQAIDRSRLQRFVLHPGGRRIVDAMAYELGLGKGDLAPTEAVLAEHGNMSSVTVLFVLDEVLRHYPSEAGSCGLVGAFGPGFAAELALLEF